MKIILLTVSLTIISWIATRAQESAPQKMLRGKIVDLATGQTLEGITLAWMHQQGHAISGKNGQFTIEYVSLPDTLHVTHVGYGSKKVEVNSPSSLTIQLSIQSAALDEVVVSTGYQKIKTNEVTGAVQVVTERQLQQQTGTNILQRLNNIAPGVRFDTRPIQNPSLQKLSMSIRGLSTINGPLDPLVVLDGFIYEGNIDNIDPNLVDNITILKDAAATSIWGARAGNGVVVISTKRGKTSQKINVSINANTIVSSKPDLGDVYEMPVGDFIDIEQFVFNNGYYDNQIGGTPWQAITPASEIFLQSRNGLISSQDSARKINALKNQNGRQEYTNYFLSRPIIQQYSLNVSGGTNNYLYSMGAGYTEDKDAYAAYGRKLNINLANTFKPIRNLDINLNVYYTHNQSRSGKPAYSSIVTANKKVPYLHLTDENGHGFPVDYTLRKAYTDEFMSGQLFSWDYYPLTDYLHNYSMQPREEFYGSASINYQLLPGLKAVAAYQYQQQNTTVESISDLESYGARVMINDFSQVDPYTGAINYIVPVGGIKRLANSKSGSSTIRGQLDLNKQWGAHSINAIAGAETRESRQNDYSFSAYGYSDDPMYTVPVDFVNYYPTLLTQSYQNIPGNAAFSASINRFVSMYATAVYQYNKKYSFSASGRRDGANIFGQTSNDRWNPLWSVGGAWNISQESFYRIKWMDQLKFRVTYGYSGNVDLRKTPLPIAEITSGMYTDYPAARISLLNDPTLRWEQIGTLNIGANFRMFNGSITGSLDYYRKKGKDLYGPSPYDYTIWGGAGLINKNVAGMRGNGIELNLQSMNLTGKFSWNTGVLFTYQSNKVAAYYDESGLMTSSLIGDGSMIIPVIGKPLYSIAAYRWAGLDESGNPQGYLNGEKSTDYLAILQEGGVKNDASAIVYKGSAVPVVYGSIINSVGFKGFSLSVNISYKAGYYFRSPATSYANLFSTGSAFKDVETRWKQPGDELVTNMPSMLYDGNSFRDGFYTGADIHVMKADHVRLEYIHLSYLFNNLLKSKTGSVEVYANAANLGIVWKANKLGIDPDYINSLRPLKTFTGGCRINF